MIVEHYDTAFFERAWGALPPIFRETAPVCGLILGSGWSAALECDEILARVPYSDIPGLGATGVVGHTGELLLATMGGRPAAVFCGRRHWYEGVGWVPVVLPVELLRRLGCQTLLLTNAAGGINSRYRPGSVVIIEDHLNFTGLSPLNGPRVAGWGTRFPDQTALYASDLRQVLREIADEAAIEVHEGVYVYAVGPTFETPAEIRAYRALGADVVGMSTVPEAMVAGAAGLKVAALSCVTNMAAGVSRKALTHAEVIEETARVKPQLAHLMTEFVKRQ